MSVMLPILSSLLLVLSVGGGMHTNSVRAEETVISNIPRITAYWQRMLPNTPMPSAILDLLATTDDDGHKREVAHFHGSITTGENDDRKMLINGQAKKNEDSKVRQSYAPIEKNDDNNLIIYGKPKKTNNQNLIIYGKPKKTNNQNLIIYGKLKKTNNENLIIYGKVEKIDGKTTKSKVEEKNDLSENKDGKTTESNVQDDGHKGEGGQMHEHIFFSEDSVMPGSTITPHILASFISGVYFLPRHVAESVPISARKFTDLMEMFAPVPSAMVDDIWSALCLCDHPPAVKGETSTCVVALESMVEFASSVLGTTHGLRAVSSPDVPAEGVKSGKRYKVTALRRVTAGAGDTVTCHGIRFPSALFMCHAVNPTRVYSVTMERDRSDIGGPERLEALFVCHLDTSDFDPTKMPGHFKPGGAPLCHFLARDNVLWAPPAAAA